VGKSLEESKLTAQGVIVLGIERDRAWNPIPRANELIQASDRVVVYGPFNVLKTLFSAG
jgi:Trk K+ transport system NAD-binding subunit